MRRSKLERSPVVTTVNRFLSEHYTSNEPLLVGVSGGVDSLALLHALLACKVQVHVVHIDHGWRRESEQEAACLQQAAKGWPIESFVVRKLPSPLEQGNHEDWARQQRLHHFAELVHTLGCVAVAVAHHADDLAETVFKRIVEGADLTKLGGLRPRRKIGALDVWRPLLTLHKEQLIDYVRILGIVPFEDATNYDTAYYRARQRVELFPRLEKSLGRPIGTSLSHVGRLSCELEEYLDERIAPYLNAVQSGPLGHWLDVRSTTLARIELRHLIRRFCQRLGWTIAREPLEQACVLLETQRANASVCCGVHHLQIDRGALFALAFSQMPTKILSTLTFGEHVIGGWRVIVDSTTQAASGDWRNLWTGSVTRLLPAGEYQLGAPQMSAMRTARQKLGEWYNKGKCPAFIRRIVPVIWQNDRIMEDFITKPKSLVNSKIQGIYQNNLSKDMIRIKLTPHIEGSES